MHSQYDKKMSYLTDKGHPVAVGFALLHEFIIGL